MLVTIYITTKNRLNLLKRAIDSVFQQTYPNIELIVVDDGSDDGTQDYLLSLRNKGLLCCILHDKSLGACVARNAAIDIAKGDFITGMDDDDWFSIDRIEKFVFFWKGLDLLKQNSISGLYSNSVELYSTGKLLKFRDDRISYQQLRLGNGIGNQIFAPNKNFKSICGFDPKMPAWQDWDCWLRMACNHGDFLNCGANTYMQDATHDYSRITEKEPMKIRYAYMRLCSKLGSMSWAEKLNLNKTLMGYHQVVPNFWELMKVLMVGDFRLFFSCIKRKFYEFFKGICLFK